MQCSDCQDYREQRDQQHRSAERKVAKLLMNRQQTCWMETSSDFSAPTYQWLSFMSFVQPTLLASGTKNVDKKCCCSFCRDAVCILSPMRDLCAYLHPQHSTCTEKMFFGIAPPGLDASKSTDWTGIRTSSHSPTSQSPTRTTDNGHDHLRFCSCLY